MNRHVEIFEVKDKIFPINPKAFILEHFYAEIHNLQGASKLDGQTTRDIYEIWLKRISILDIKLVD